MTTIVSEAIAKHEKNVFSKAPDSTINNYLAIVNAQPVRQSWIIKNNLNEAIANSAVFLLDNDEAQEQFEIVESQKMLIRQAHLDFLATEPIKKLIEEQDAENARREIEIRAAWEAGRKWTPSAEAKARQAAIDKKLNKACIMLSQQIEQILLPHQRNILRSGVIHRYLQNKTWNQLGGRIQCPLPLSNQLEFDASTHEQLEEMTKQSIQLLNKEINAHDTRPSRQIARSLDQAQKRFFADLVKNKHEIPNSIDKITETYRSLLGFNDLIKAVR